MPEEQPVSEPPAPLEQSAPEPVALVPQGPQMPALTPFQQRADAGEIWRLCCRLRLAMRDDGLGIKDAHKALLLAYPDLDMNQKTLKRFMENVVDESVLIDQGYYKRGMMKADAKLNAVVAAAEVAETTEKLWRKAIKKVGSKDGPTLAEATLAGKRVLDMRAKQFEMMGKIGMGPQSAEDAAQSKSMPQAAPVIVKAEGDTHIHFDQAVGGSFKRRRKPIDVDGQPKPASTPG